MIRNEHQHQKAPSADDVDRMLKVSHHKLCQILLSSLGKISYTIRSNVFCFLDNKNNELEIFYLAKIGVSVSINRKEAC